MALRFEEDAFDEDEDAVVDVDDKVDNGDDGDDGDVGDDVDDFDDDGDIGKPVSDEWAFEPSGSCAPRRFRGDAG